MHLVHLLLHLGLHLGVEQHVVHLRVGDMNLQIATMILYSCQKRKHIPLTAQARVFVCCVYGIAAKKGFPLTAQARVVAVVSLPAEKRSIAFTSSCSSETERCFLVRLESNYSPLKDGSLEVEISLK